MRHAIFLICTLLVFLFTGCGTKHKFWDISKFHLDSTALRDGEAIKLLYTSSGPDYNNDREYYIHLIAVSQKSGDTVNILTTAYNDIKRSYGDTVYNYFDQNNFASKIIQTDPGTSITTSDLAEIEKQVPKNITKVFRDPQFDDIADNNFPTVIGTIGKLTKLQK